MVRKNQTDFAILECLKEIGPQGFKQLRENVQKRGITGHGNLLRSLKNLRKGGLVEHDLDTRKYYITDTGKMLLQNDQLRELMLNRKSSIRYDTFISDVGYFMQAYPKEAISEFLFGSRRAHTRKRRGKSSSRLLVKGQDEGRLIELRKRFDSFKKIERKSFAFGKEKGFGHAFAHNVTTPFPGLSYNLPIDLFLITNREVDPKTLFRLLEEDLKWYIQSLTFKILDAVGELKGFESPYQSADPKDFRYIDEAFFIRRAYDFELTLMLHINGKELVNQVQWNTLIETARRMDEESQKDVALKSLQLDNQWKTSKEKILSSLIEARLERADIYGQIFPKRIDESQFISRSVSTTEQGLLQKIAGQIADTDLVKGRATREEISDVLARKHSEGEFEIVPTTLYTVRLRKRQESLDKEEQELVDLSAKF